MKEQLSHILEQSVCLSRKQMKEYLSGSMLPEEIHAAELHISSCPLCSMAMDGFQEHTEDALAAIASLNSGFLKEHFDNIAPQIHLNSMAPAASMSQNARSSASTNTWIRPASIAAGLLLVCLGAWYLASRSRMVSETTHEFASTSAGPVNQVSTDNVAGNQSDFTPAHPLAPDANASSSRKTATSASAIAPSSDSRTGSLNSADGHAASGAHKKAADASLGAAYYYQPEPNAGDDPTQPPKTPQTILPSASDPAKIYDGPISSRTTKMYVPEPAEALATVPTHTNAAPVRALNAAPPKPAARVHAEDAATADRHQPARQLSSPSAAMKPAALPSSPDAAQKPPAKRTDESPDGLFERGEYRVALTKYRQQLRSNDPDVRSHASLQAARCYAALGEPARAEELLRKVVDQGNGRDRRTARKLLRNLH